MQSPEFHIWRSRGRGTCKPEISIEYRLPEQRYLKRFVRQWEEGRFVGLIDCSYRESMESLGKSPPSLL